MEIRIYNLGEYLSFCKNNNLDINLYDSYLKYCKYINGGYYDN